MVLAAGSLWGTIGFFSTLLSDMGMSASMAAFFRVLPAAGVLALVLLIKGRGLSLFRVSKRGLLSCFLVGITVQGFFNLSYMNAIDQIGMATAAVFLYTSPIYVAIMSRLFFREPLTRNKIAAIFINIAGCILTVTGGNFSDTRLSVSGILTGALAGFLYSLLPILSRIGADREDPITATFYGQLFGTLLLLFIIKPYNGTGAEFSLKLLLLIIGFGIVPSAMAFITYFGGLKRISETSRVPVLASVETVVASLIGLVAFGQTLGAAKIAGIALVLCSIAVMNKKQADQN